MPSAKIAPSMLSSDFANLAAEAKRMVKNGADWLHLGKKKEERAWRMPRNLGLRSFALLIDFS